MKKYLLLVVIFTAFSFTNAQTLDQQQISNIAKAYTSAGDTVGIYVIQNGNKELMESIKFTGMKANALGTALTYGIAKTKIKVEFADVTSPYIFSGGKAQFRFYFGMVPANKTMRLYMFSNNYSLRDFSVSKFIVKKDKRQLVQGSYSLFSGVSTGVESDNTVKIDHKEIRDGVYDVTVTAQPGEYCFVFTNNGVGAYNTVFDFTIK